MSNLKTATDMEGFDSTKGGFNGTILAAGQGGQGGPSFEDLGYQPFSATKTYAVGDVVIYAGALYKFTSAHLAGAWVGNDAAETTVEELINEACASIYEVSSLEDIPAGTATLINADYIGGKTVLVKESTLIGSRNCYSVVSAKSDNTYNYFTLLGKNCLYELKFNKIAAFGELATLTTTAIPKVNDPTVTINQGGTTKGTFSLNQSGPVTINLDDGKVSRQVVTELTSSIELQPNVFYVLLNVGETLAVTLAAPTDATIVNEYMLEFETGKTPPSVSFPSFVLFPTELSVEAGKRYQFSIFDNIALYVGAEIGAL